MKRRILLIEDRAKRQNDFFELSQINLDKYENILDNKINNEFNNFMDNIKEDKFNLNFYDVIIAHDSIFKEENKKVLETLQTYCSDKKKSLVLFSGNNGISYSNDEYETLNINSKNLYSQNLILFLKDFEKENINIRILAFGEKWKTNILLNMFETMNLFIDKTEKEKVLINVFKRDNNIYFSNLDTLDVELYKYEEVDNKIYLSEIVKLRDSILNSIKELAND